MWADEDWHVSAVVLQDSDDEVLVCLEDVLMPHPDDLLDPDHPHTHVTHGPSGFTIVATNSRGSAHSSSTAMPAAALAAVAAAELQTAAAAVGAAAAAAAGRSGSSSAGALLGRSPLLPAGGSLSRGNQLREHMQCEEQVKQFCQAVLSVVAGVCYFLWLSPSVVLLLVLWFCMHCYLHCWAK
jgi:hypothetical protein